MLVVALLAVCSVSAHAGLSDGTLYTSLESYTAAAAAAETTTPTAAVAASLVAAFVETCNVDTQLQYKSTWSDATENRLVVVCPAETSHSTDVCSYLVTRAFYGQPTATCIPGDMMAISAISDEYPFTNHC